MASPHNHIIKTIRSTIAINSSREKIWENITNVRIEQFSDPLLFKLLGIPKPLRADMLAEGAGGQRIAYFDTGKRFIQEITCWKPPEEYAFNFNPEKGFIAGHFFDLSDGIFRVPDGRYTLVTKGDVTILQLSTTYSLNKNVFFLFNLPVKFILSMFQTYLLKAIKRNSE